MSRRARWSDKDLMGSSEDGDLEPRVTRQTGSREEGSGRLRAEGHTKLGSRGDWGCLSTSGKGILRGLG